jgi:hypothetical protein
VRENKREREKKEWTREKTIARFKYGKEMKMKMFEMIYIYIYILFQVSK